MKMTKLGMPGALRFETATGFQDRDFSSAERVAQPLQPQFSALGRMRGAGSNPGSRSFGLFMAVGVHMALALAWFASGTVITPLKPPEPVVLVDVVRPERPTSPEPVKKIDPPAFNLPLVRLQVPVPDIAIVETTTNAPRAVAIPDSRPALPQTPDRAAVVDTFQIKLLKHLSRYKRYPAAAKAKREQGVAFVHFTMDLEGRVLSARVETSSGFAALDTEGIALLNRAQPLPKPPADLEGNPLALIVPVEFFVR